MSLPTYRLFGVTIASDVAVPAAAPGDGPPVLQVSEDEALEFPDPPAVSSFRETPDGLVRYEIAFRGDETFLRIEPVGVFCCAADRIRYRRLGAPAIESLFWLLYGIVFAVWLERRGFPAIHAAVVETDGAAVGFLGEPGAGKSSLTAAWVRRGHRVLGDDHLVIDSRSPVIHAIPSVPWLKLSPATVRWLDRDPDSLPLFHPGLAKRRFDLTEASRAHAPLRLRRLYSLQRDPSAAAVSIHRMSAAEGLRALIGHSHAPRMAAAAGLDTDRLPILARVLNQTGLRRLRYPDGLSRLDEVIDAVRHDAA